MNTAHDCAQSPDEYLCQLHVGVEICHARRFVRGLFESSLGREIFIIDFQWQIDINAVWKQWYNQFPAQILQATLGSLFFPDGTRPPESGASQPINHDENPRRCKLGKDNSNVHVDNVGAYQNARFQSSFSNIQCDSGRFR
jgi:hypothetical protein